MADETKTQVYGSSGDIGKTQTYGSQPSGSTNSIPQQELEPEKRPVNRTTSHNLGTGDRIDLNGSAYEIVQIISGDNVSGEAVVYKVKNSAGQDLALKMYYQFSDPRDEPRTEALSRIRQMDESTVLKLYDFGTGANKYQGKFCFEISTFAEGGDLLSVSNIKAKYTPDFVEETVLPQILKGIKTFHEFKIYHCDLKPQNVFYVDREQSVLALADYGSAKTLDESSEKEIVKTTMVKGTDFYLAPEQARGVISEKNDHYSLGMILLHLLYPDQITSANLTKIIERQFAGRMIIDYDNMTEMRRFNQLIAGLTLQDIKERWGKDEVERWMKGEDVPVTYPSQRGLSPIKVGTVTIRSVDDLFKYIDSTNTWYAILVEDHEGYGMLLSWMASLSNLQQKKIFDGMIQYYKNDGAKYVREAMSRWFKSEQTVVLGDETFNVFTEGSFKELADKFVVKLDDMLARSSIEDVKFAVFQFEFALGQLMARAAGNLRAQIRAFLDKIAVAFGAPPKPDYADMQCALYPLVTEERLIKLFHANNPERGFRYEGDKYLAKIDEIGLYFARNKDAYIEPRMATELDVFLKSNKLDKLAGLNYTTFLTRVFEKEVKVDIDITQVSIVAGGGRGNLQISYKMGKSLGEFFRQHDIEREIVDYGPRIEKVVIKKGIKDFLEAIAAKHKIEPDSIDDSVKQKLEEKLKSSKQQQRSQRMQANFGGVWDDVLGFVGFWFKSTLLLLPVFALVLLTLATVKHDPKIIGLLDKITPFTMQYDVTFANLKGITLYGMHAIMLVSLLPMLVLSFFEDLDLSGFARGVYLNLGIFLLLAPFITLGVVYVVLLGWGAFAPAVHSDYKLTADIATRLVYYIPGILLVLLTVITSYGIRREFRFLPFTLSLLVYAYMSFVLFGDSVKV